MYRYNTFILLLISVLAGVLLLARSSMGGLKTGDPMPNLAAFSLQGALPKTRGQVVLLDFWASWCGPCKASFPEMEKIYKADRLRGFTIVAVSVDERQQNMRRFVKSMNVSFPVVWDAQQKLVAAADVQTMPTSFLIDRAGRIRFVHHGFRGENTAAQYRLELDQLLREKAP